MKSVYMIVFTLAFIIVVLFVYCTHSNTFEKFETLTDDIEVIKEFKALPQDNMDYLDKKANKRVTFDGNVKLFEYDVNNSPIYFDTNAESVNVQTKPFISNDENENIIVGDSNIPTTFLSSETKFEKPVTFLTQNTNVNHGQFLYLAHFNDIHVNQICFDNQAKHNCITKKPTKYVGFFCSKLKLFRESITPFCLIPSFQFSINNVIPLNISCICCFKLGVDPLPILVICSGIF